MARDLESGSNTLRELVNSHISTMRDHGITEIPAPLVAQQICERFPHYSELDTLEREASYIGVAQVARDVLRNRHNAEWSARDAESKTMRLDLPEESLLNDAYSVQRSGEYVYVDREAMTREDMEYVCAKFLALSQHFDLAARAVRADWMRRNQMVLEPA